MGKILAVSLVVFLAVLTPSVRAQGDSAYEGFSPDQLDNLLAPIALYPDPLLAQVLVAATFPDQIDAAARFVRDDNDADDVDGQRWDVSVKAVAHYPTVLAMMADKLDWTTALGQAYANQSSEVMASVQRLRAQARAAGNLQSSSELEVVDSGGEIELWPAQAEYMYVPRYDPEVVFFHRAPLFFGPRFFIGAWLNYDFDWRGHRVFYHGWEGDRGWIGRSRHFIHPNDVYWNVRNRNFVINRHVINNRWVNYGALNRYDDIHRNTNFDNFHRTNRIVTPPLPPPIHVMSPNKMIFRNIDTTDRRIYDFRGHLSKPPALGHLPAAPGFPSPGGAFDPRVVSRRGQTSRALIPPPPPPPLPFVRHSSAAPSPGQERKDRHKP
jgi:hypothetical protein